MPVCKSCCNSVSQVKVDGSYEKIHKSDSFTADEHRKSLIETNNWISFRLKILQASIHHRGFEERKRLYLLNNFMNSKVGKDQKINVRWVLRFLKAITLDNLISVLLLRVDHLQLEEG